jgi:Fe-S-cluster containining protein
METNSILCDIGRCHAECCGPVPIPENLYLNRKHLLQRKVKEFQGVFAGTVIAVDKNMTCGFLTKDFKCAIYNERPEVCQKFGSVGETHLMLICPEKRKWVEDNVFIKS